MQPNTWCTVCNTPSPVSVLATCQDCRRLVCESERCAYLLASVPSVAHSSQSSLPSPPLEIVLREGADPEVVRPQDRTIELNLDPPLLEGEERYTNTALCTVCWAGYQQPNPAGALRDPHLLENLRLLRWTRTITSVMRRVLAQRRLQETGRPHPHSLA